MAMLIKYRVHEVAKDFNLTSKDISEILTKYATTPKNHMQVLETPELDLIFESLTQKNQVENLEELLTAKPKEEPVKEKAEKKAAPSASEKGEKAAPAPQPTPAKEKKDKPHVPRKQAEKRVVDTRGSASINIDKYDEKFDNLASTGDERRDSQFRRGGKQKIGNNKKQHHQQANSTKRRQEEKQRMQKLQLEIAKKQPVKVSIPDEISVGELASRMKRTAACSLLFPRSSIMIQQHLLPWRWDARSSVRSWSLWKKN